MDFSYSTVTLGELLTHPNKEIRRHAIGAYKAILKHREDICLHAGQIEIIDGYRITFCWKCGKTLKKSSL